MSGNSDAKKVGDSTPLEHNIPVRPQPKANTEARQPQRAESEVNSPIENDVSSAALLNKGSESQRYLHSSYQEEEIFKLSDEDQDDLLEKEKVLHSLKEEKQASLTLGKSKLRKQATKSAISFSSFAKDFTKFKKQIKTENLKKRFKEGQKEVQKAILRRKTVRFIALGVYLAVIAIIVAIALTILIKKGSVFASNNASFDITMENCTLLIQDHTDADISNPIYLKYQGPRAMQADQGLEVISSSDGNTQNFYIKNVFDPRYCLVQLFVRSDAQINQLKISCPNCNITQDNSFQLKITGALDISGDVINANFRNIAVGSISYNTVSGYLQLSNVDTSSAANQITIQSEGDIIIQSTNEFQVDVTTPTQTFCFSAPTVNVDTSTPNNCAIANVAGTETNLGNTNCHIISTLCNSGTCSPTTKYTVVSNISNVYANIIPSVGTPTLTTNTPTKGLIYNNGLDFSPAAKTAVSNFDTLVNDETKGNPFIILDLGNLDSRSSRFNKWVISSTPSYSYMRPWWIGTMSATVLNGYTEYVKGFLVPGVCPYVPEYTTESLLEIQTLIASKINTEKTLITFVNDESMPLPPSTPQMSSGVFYYAPRGNPFDKWLNVVQLQNGNIVFQNNDYTSQGQILAAIILSLVIAAYVAFLLTELTIIAINEMYHKLVDFTNHVESYSKLDKSKAQRAVEDPKTNKAQKVVQKKHTLLNILHHSPSPSAFIDYLSLILYRQFTSSVIQFYDLLFSEVSPDRPHDQEFDPGQSMIKGGDAKILYEKFCFVNHFIEEKLTDKANEKILRQYGFDVVTREEIKIETFTRINVKNFDNFLINPLNDYENMDSLEIYMKENVQITDFQEDQLEVETFIKIYYDFCEHNRLDKVVISPTLMKDKFNIDTKFVAQQFIMRKEDQRDQNEEEAKKNQTPLAKNLNAFLAKYRPKAKKIYVIDTSKLTNNFNLVMNKLTEMTPAQLESATKELILYPRWQMWDCITVLLHLLVGACLSLPLVVLAILNESQYEPWSLKEPLQLIRFIDIIRDPRALIYNLYHGFTWNVIIMAVVTVLWALTLLDLVLYYYVMEFPQDKSFKKSENKGENLLHKISRVLGWILILLTLACYFGYIGLVLTWLLLGAFINPNSFLPFASGTVTFVTFVTSKYKAFKKLWQQGSEAVMAYLKTFFGEFINKLLGKITENLENAVNDITDKGKLALESDAFKSATEKLAETGLVDASTISEYTEKIKQIDGQSALAGALAVATDPSIALKEINNLAAALKAKTIEKLKEECSKRGIPPSLVDFVIATSSKDTGKMKENLLKMVTECNAKLKMPPAGIDIIVELLFPQSINKEEMVTFITTKMMNIIFENTDLKKVEYLTPEVLIKAFSNLKNIQDMKLEEFVKGLKELLNNFQKVHNLKEFDFFLPVLDIIVALSAEQKQYQDLKNSAFRFLLSVVAALSKDKTEDNVRIIKDFVQFLSIMSSNYETPRDFITGQTLDNNDLYRIIQNFCRTFRVNEPFTEFGKPEMPSALIYFIIAYARQEMYDLPTNFVRDVEKIAGVDSISKTDFFPFCFNLASTLFNTPEQFHNRLRKRISKLDFEQDLENFVKILAFYSLDSFKIQYSYVSAENNKFVQEIAKAIKIQPNELLGLIDIIYNKKSDQHKDAFLAGALQKMGVKLDKLELIKSLVNLFLSEDETLLLHAAKVLNLDLGQFLLVGKGILDPKFISEKLFNEIGITDSDLVNEKDTIKASSEDSFEFWKGQLRKKLQDTINSLEKQYMAQADIGIQIDSNDKKLTGQETLLLEKKLADANLVKLYLNDWKTFAFSKKNISVLVSILDNRQNELKDKLSITEKGSNYNGIDLLSTILSIKQLELDQGKRYNQLDKEKQSAINILSDAMSLNQEVLTSCLQLFVLKDPKIVLEKLVYFFPDLKAVQEALQKILFYTFKQVLTIQNQIEFILSKLSSTIEPQAKSIIALPKGVFKKLLFEASESRMNVSTALEFADIAIRKFASGELKQKLDEVLYDISLFAKGLLSKDQIRRTLSITDERLLKLFDILTQTDNKLRLSMITELFDKDDPIKLAIAFYGLLTRQNFKIYHNIGGGKIKEESIKQYLASKMNIYPEIFDLFDIAFERKIPKFIEKALPMLRRITANPYLDSNLLESLLSLSLGEHFNSGYLAHKLEISPDIIEFFVAVLRLTDSNTRTKELQTIATSLPIQKVFGKLNIKSKEIIALSKLIFGIFEKDDASLNEILKGIGLKKESGTQETKDLINLEVLKGFISLHDYVEPSENLFKYRKALADKKLETRSLLSYLNLSSDSDCALIITRLFCGDFLVLREFKQELDWAFPNDGSQADVAIRNMTMALCGLLNPNIEVSHRLKEDINLFIKTFYNKEKDFEELKYEPVPADKKQVLPNNSLAYAIYLAFQALDLDPIWMQAFLLDPQTFIEINAKLPNLKIEFLLGFVLTFLSAREFSGDYASLYEWNIYCAKFCGLDPDSKLSDPNLSFSDSEMFVKKFLTLNFLPMYDKIISTATQLGLFKNKFWRKYLGSRETFNTKLNQTFLYLITLDEPDVSKRKELLEVDAIKNAITIDSYNFLVNMERYLYSIKNSPPDQFIWAAKDFGRTGKLIVTALQNCYSMVAKRFNPEGQRIPGYELTNLCMLRTIMALRNSAQTKMPYNKKLYNLHQLVICIERKFYLENHYYRMSKFKVLKFIGIVFGMQLNNIIEFCLPAPLFTPDYVKALSAADPEKPEDLRQIRISQCEKVVFNYTDDSNIVGDTGIYPGTYGEYHQKREYLPSLLDWKLFEIWLRLDDYYLGDPQLEEFKLTESHIKDQHELAEACKTENNRVYLSREIVSLLFNGDNKPSIKAPQIDQENAKQVQEKNRLNKKDLLQRREGKRKAEEDSETSQIKDTTIDAKTGRTYRDLERKCEEFEEVLTDPNMNLLLGVIKGDISVLSKEDHVMGQGDEQKTRIMAYMALVGLHCFSKGLQKDKNTFREYLTVLIPYMESNIPKLEELMRLFIYKQVNLIDCASALELPETMIDLLLMRVKEGDMSQPVSDEKEEQNQAEDTVKKFSIIKAIQKLLEVEESELETFEMIRNVYQLKEKDGWLKLINTFIKSPPNQAATAIKLLNHPLLELVKKINFKKLAKEVSSLKSNDILSFFKMDGNHKGDAIGMIFEEIILMSDLIFEKGSQGAAIVNEIQEKKEFIKKVYSVIQVIINQDFHQLFEMLMLTNGEKVDLKTDKKDDYADLMAEMQEVIQEIKTPEKQETPQEPFLEELLNYLGVDTKIPVVKDSIKLLQIFLTLVCSNLSKYKEHTNYKAVINKVITDISESSLIPQTILKDDEELGNKIKTLVPKLLLGILAWDFELICEAFISQETLQESFVLYHVFGALKLSKALLLEGDGSFSELQNHLRVLLLGVLKAITSDGIVDMLLWSSKEKDFSNLLQEEDWENTMEQKISELFTDTLPKMNQQKPKSLLEYASQAIKERQRESLTLSIYFDSALTLITSICDGTIIARFLDLGFDSEVDSTLVLDILKFVLSLAEKFFTPAGDKIDYEDIISSFNSCASSLQKFIEKDGKNEIVDAVVGYVPDIMKIYLTLEGDSKDLEKTKVNVLAIIKKVINQVAFPQRKELLYNLLTIVLGINMNIFDEQNPGTKVNFDVQPSDRIRMFITKILPAIFPQLTNYCKEEDFIKVYDLIMKLNTDFKTNFKDIQIQRQIVKDIATLLAHFRVCDPDLVNSIVSLMDGNIEGAKYLLQMVLPDSVPNENVDRMISYVGEMKSMLNIDFSSKLALFSKAEGKKKKNMDELSWGAIMKKIAEGKASPKDLFKVVDQEGDNSGTISTTEFEILANRLGIKLSEHRIKEIFAKVKENKARGSSEYELNEKEFEEALGYLESKNLTQALQILGITPEILTAILIRLIILLILIFAFIFVGISAFAIGGTFGAIINSLFPVAGGAGLSKQSDTDKDKLESTNVTKAAETGLDITFSEQL